MGLRAAAVGARSLAMALLTPDVDPLWIAYYDYERGSTLPRHAHRDYFQLIVIIAGTGEGSVGEHRVPLRPGQIFFLCPGVVHGLEAGRFAQVRTLDTKFRIRNRVLRRACLGLAPIRQTADSRLTALLQAIHAEAQHAGVNSAEVCQTLLAQVLLLLIRGAKGDSAAALPLAKPGHGSSDLGRRLHEYLREHCGEKLSQRRLTAVFHYSYTHLHAMYRLSYGESPLRALWRFRLERATQLLRYSDYEIKRIAELAGFASVHHFTRMFRRTVGMPPAQWRDNGGGEVKGEVIIHRGFINQYLVRSARA